MIKAKINPKYLASFLERLANENQNDENYLDWISTHPSSNDRVEYINSYSFDKFKIAVPILDTNTWNNLKEELLN